MIMNFGPIGTVSGGGGKPVYTYTGEHELVESEGGWQIKFLTSGTLRFSKAPGDIDAFLVGGGAGGYPSGYSIYGDQHTGGHGGGDGQGLTVKGIALEKDTDYVINVGEGGGSGTAGGDTTAFGSTAKGGAVQKGGATGGGNGAAGTIHAFDDPAAPLYGGCGGGGGNGGDHPTSPGNGGAPGGGNGGASAAVPYAGENGKANTGGGGGGAGGYYDNKTYTNPGGKGGSGIVIIRKAG